MHQSGVVPWPLMVLVVGGCHRKGWGGLASSLQTRPSALSLIASVCAAPVSGSKRCSGSAALVGPRLQAQWCHGHARSELLIRQPVLLALALVPLLFTPACAAPGPRAFVVSVGDGDTIRVRLAGEVITVRLACIDAPEMNQGGHGRQSRRSLRERLPIGQEVRLDVKTTDRYGRSVAEVFRGVNINLAMVEDGEAFAYRRYLSRCDRQAYLDAEERASRRRLGVWQAVGGITRPWEFRRDVRRR